MVSVGGGSGRVAVWVGGDGGGAGVDGRSVVVECAGAVCAAVSEAVDVGVGCCLVFDVGSVGDVGVGGLLVVGAELVNGCGGDGVGGDGRERFGVVGDDGGSSGVGVAWLVVVVV